MTKTKERPILFNGPMVRAILAGKKTQTRRPLKPQPGPAPEGEYFDAYRGGKRGVSGEHSASGACFWTNDNKQVLAFWAEPPAAVGDVLWVRETWQKFDQDADSVPLDRLGPASPTKGIHNGRSITWRAAYLADGQHVDLELGEVKWQPSIHMPRWAARIFLRVTDVRVQRVQDITEEDARAEGMQEPSVVQAIGGGDVTERRVFARLWSSVYGASSWERDEWVWALTFERVDPTR